MVAGETHPVRATGGRGAEDQESPQAHPERPAQMVAGETHPVRATGGRGAEDQESPQAHPERPAQMVAEETHPVRATGGRGAADSKNPADKTSSFILPPTFILPDGVSADIVATQQRLIESRLAEYHAALQAAWEQKQERLAEARVVRQEIDKLTETIPLLEEQVEARADLVDKGLSPRFQFLEYQERLVSQKKDLQIQRDQLSRVQASIRAVEQQMDQIREEFRKTVLMELAEAEDKEAALRQELTKNRKRRELQVLRAPVDGRVQQLAVHTIGGVVNAGDALMVVVPDGSALMVEAHVLNKDIGFVREGQAVEVKLEAFPFTKYGVIPGRLDHLAQDAVNDENLGLVYPARISIERSTIHVNGKEVPLGPGMALTAEIKTGQRRLIEFLLSPLLRYKDESLRER
ncbi:HlyD family type I secretion periplasmic adaptor subunit [Luteithermobacter gelatinilyticus]|uniref:HlyD family type I secretion periplasmic adaptor subunit n=1 Tax=Luteithermobacter gelatinilyticus TaxID=2582913 RepID=UPI00110656ED|nr:HlyD family type I secretion periplasmic adaptor subunit [Luteithermobacter gelatinilyticus]